MKNIKFAVVCFVKKTISISNLMNGTIYNGAKMGMAKKWGSPEIILESFLLFFNISAIKPR